MKLLTREIERNLPALYSQDGKGEDARVAVKFFLPEGAATWLVTEGEYDEDEGTWRFFGWVTLGWEWECGYFSLAELEMIRGKKLRLPVERDLHLPDGITIRECIHD